MRAKPTERLSPRLQAAQSAPKGVGVLFNGGLTLTPDRDGGLGWRVLGSATVGKERAMSALEPIPFVCPGCGAKYKIALIDPPSYDARNTTIKCAHCGVALRSAKGSAFFYLHIATLWQLVTSRKTSKDARPAR